MAVFTAGTIMLQALTLIPCNNCDMIYDCNHNAPTPTTSSPPPPASAAPASQGTREAEEKVEKLERVCRSARVDSKRLQKVPGPFWIGLLLIISSSEGSSSHVEGDSQRRMRYVGVNRSPSV
jgi:hypothetical protein